MPIDNFDKIAKEGNILDRLERAETRGRSTTRKNVKSARLSNLANEMGEVDFRAVDTDGNLRVVMSAHDLFDELGVHAHLVGLDATGDVQFYLSADDGTVVAADGNVTLSKAGIVVVANATYDPFITFYDGATALGFIYINIFGALEVAAFDELYLSGPNGVLQFIKLTNGTFPRVTFREDPANVNTSQLFVGNAANGSNISINDAVIIWQGKDGKETVFNDNSYDIDHRWEGATDANLFKLDAGLDAAAFGGAAESGYKLKVFGNLRVTGSIISPSTADGGGWVAGAFTWAYSSADSPVFFASIPDEDASLINVGDKIKITQTTVKYFIVVAKSTPSGGSTPVALYGGTDYTLANAAITLPYYSHAKSPLGFPLDDDKWTVSASNTANAHKTPPTQNVWYGGAGLTNTGISIDVPIGAWRGYAKSVLESEDTTVTDYNCYMTFSTANNTESNTDNTGFIALTVPSGTYKIWSVLTMTLKVTVAAKTTHYLNIKTSTTTADAIHMRGDVVPTIIKLVCNYL